LKDLHLNMEDTQYLLSEHQDLTESDDSINEGDNTSPLIKKVISRNVNNTKRRRFR
jgi:hypothetical protein